MRYDYEDRRLLIQTNDRIEERIREYADKHDLRIPRARRQLIERGLVAEEVEIPPTREEKEPINEAKSHADPSVGEGKSNHGSRENSTEGESLYPTYLGGRRK